MNAARGSKRTSWQLIPQNANPAQREPVVGWAAQFEMRVDAVFLEVYGRFEKPVK